MTLAAEQPARVAPEIGIWSTVEYVSHALFGGRELAGSQRERLALAIAARQGGPEAYAGTFAPLPGELSDGLRTFSGELIESDAGGRCVLGQEALRALVLLRPEAPESQAALERATEGMLNALRRHEAEGRKVGMYCCCTCSVALWRLLAAGGLDRQDQRLEAGVALLRQARLSGGRWKGFPFFYSVLALMEMPHVAGSRDELSHAAPVLRRFLARPAPGAYSPRRQLIARKALAAMGETLPTFTHYR